MEYHKPVMLDEVLTHLQIKPGGIYIDCTLGDGGHTVELLKLGAKVIGLEVDPVALKRATNRISSLGLEKNFVGRNVNFKNIDTITEPVDGILFDLGYSSYQLDEAAYGLSFLRDEILDMRLDKANLSVTAADLVNALPEKSLAKIFRDYADEMLANKFAHAIVTHRSLKKIQTTKDLANLLYSVASPSYEHGRIHPATRVFQALRIAVNDELGNLEMSLPRAARLLLPGGRMIVISFHSLEDKVVKEFGRFAQPMIKAVTKKPIVPTDREVHTNSRSRSAKMRVFEKSI